MPQQLTLTIYGLVQGVGFRAAACEKAKSFGLAGYAINQKEGSVLIIVEGEEQNLKKLIVWCYNGVDSARVERVEQQWSKATGQYQDFVIK